MQRHPAAFGMGGVPPPSIIPAAPHQRLQGMGRMGFPGLDPSVIPPHMVFPMPPPMGVGFMPHMGMPPNMMGIMPNPNFAPQRGPGRGRGDMRFGGSIIQDRTVHTVYVGHISPDVPDDIIKQLLMECGRVLKWTRTQDPTSRQLSPFGFCEFDDPQGVWRATKLLHDSVLDSRKLVVTCQDKAKEMLEAWHSERTANAQAQNPSLTPQDVVRQLEQEEENVKKALIKMLGEAHVRLEREKARQRAAAAALNAKAKGEGDVDEAGGADEAAGTLDIIPSAPSALPGGSDGDITPPVEPTTPRVRDSRDAEDAKGSASKKPSDAQGPPKITDPSILSAVDAAKRVAAEAISARGGAPVAAPVAAPPPAQPQGMWLTSDYRVNYREKDRELRCTQRQKERDREFGRREREWLRTEDMARKERKRYREREMAKLSVSPQTRERLIKLDLRGEWWDGPPSKRRREERRRAREKEKMMDDADRKEEEEELRLAKERAAAAGIDESEITGEAEEGEIGRDGISGKVWGEGGDLDGDSKELNGLKREKADSESGARMALGGTKISFKSTQAATQSGRRAGSGVQSGAFLRGDEDDSTPHKPLTKLETLMDPTNLDEERKQKEAIKKIAQMVPSGKEDVFNFDVDFQLLADNNVFESKLRPWVSKRVTEFLGNEEEEMVEYLLERLSQRPKASQLLEELVEMIDTEAEGFLVRMWRVLIFEQLRLQQTQSQK